MFVHVSCLYEKMPVRIFIVKPVWAPEDGCGKMIVSLNKYAQ